MYFVRFVVLPKGYPDNRPDNQPNPTGMKMGGLSVAHTDLECGEVVSGMTTRKLHRAAGLVMLLPLTAWALTGAVFYLKPGYVGAYETLQVRSYSLEPRLAWPTDPAWLELRVLKTILGEHLLARTPQGWLHLDPSSLQPKPYPSNEEIRALIADAILSNPGRYGQIVNVEGSEVTTDTGIRISLDWNRLSLSQRGRDTDRIDLLYKIHYLQWTGVRTLDKVLGMLGILLVLVLSALGARLFFSRGQ